MATTDSRHNLLAVALLALALAALLALAAAPPVALGHKWGKDMEHKQLQLQKLTRAQAQLRQMQQRGDKALALPENSLVKAANASLAAAQLQSSLKNLVEDSRGMVLRTQIIDSSFLDQELPFTPISLLMQMRGDIGFLQSVLHSIHRHQPDLFITRLHVDNRQFGHRGREPSSPILLTISITVHGFMENEDG